jgi:hypothetical protein
MSDNILAIIITSQGEKRRRGEDLSHSQWTGILIFDT